MQCCSFLIKRDCRNVRVNISFYVPEIFCSVASLHHTNTRNQGYTVHQFSSWILTHFAVKPSSDHFSVSVIRPKWQQCIFFILIYVPCILYYFVLWPTNAQLSHKISHSYMYRHYRVILRELVINALTSYTSILNAAVGNRVCN